MIDVNKENPKTIWAETGIPRWLCKPDHSRDDRAYEGLRSSGMDQTQKTEDVDAWIESSLKLVARNCSGVGKNQRRVRYFGFETTHKEANE
jgi:hypothetical protein